MVSVISLRPELVLKTNPPSLPSKNHLRDPDPEGQVTAVATASRPPTRNVGIGRNAVSARNRLLLLGGWVLTPIVETLGDRSVKATGNRRVKTSYTSNRYCTFAILPGVPSEIGVSGECQNPIFGAKAISASYLDALTRSGIRHRMNPFINASYCASCGL